MHSITLTRSIFTNNEKENMCIYLIISKIIAKYSAFIRISCLITLKYNESFMIG